MTADELQSLLHIANDSPLGNEDAEKIIDMSVNCIVLFGNVDISNMSGTAGSKSLTVDQDEYAAIFLVARAVYSVWKGPSNVNMGNVTVSTPDLLSNPEVLRAVKEAAEMLQRRGTDWAEAFI